jgi:maltose alpha-D-glucosyltransferase / alpha-amylase
MELMHAILFSLPGSPVLYYSDEIAMGDNVFLGDRDGVRTPMQWTGDRNGGFSRADFAQLYAPPLMDPVCGFQAVNVEAQLRTPTSFLSWLKRFIALRKEHPVFGLGTYEPLQPSNPKIFAHMRRCEDDVALCVHNLARSAQAVELDLSEHQGRDPIELFGRTRFRRSANCPTCSRSRHAASTGFSSRTRTGCAAADRPRRPPRAIPASARSASATSRRRATASSPNARLAPGARRRPP